MTKAICILGSTGTIGDNTLDVITRHPDRFSVVALTANSNVEKIFEQCRKIAPRYAILSDTVAATALAKRVRASGLPTEVLAGHERIAAIAAADEVDTVVTGIVGAAGLLPTLSAVKAGKQVLIANKEPLVMMGQAIMQAGRRSGAGIIPVDSEHNAIFQCLPADYLPANRSLTACGVRRITLTASGGPFRRHSRAELAAVTAAQACAHPNWSMGPKISVDSATLMNKGLEYIEACHLFNARPDQVDIVIHPQSIVHSMVEYVDGSVLAQMGPPDMRTPIANALAWPQRCDSGVSSLNFTNCQTLEFEPPDEQKFPCLGLAKQAVRIGGVAPTVLNAANEVAVDAFLHGKIAFLDISELVSRTLERLASSQDALDVDAVLAIDSEARRYAGEIIAESKLNRTVAVRATG